VVRPAGLAPSPVYHGVASRLVSISALIMIRGSSRRQGTPLTSTGACKLQRRPRALVVGWGHERLVGCRALEPCH
jgi:hypothetical protein